MTTQQVLIAILTFFSGGGLISLISFFVYRKRTKAEVGKIDAETKAKLAEAKNLEAQAANTLSDAVSDIISGFQSLIKKTDEKNVEHMLGLGNEIKMLKVDYEDLRKAYVELKADHEIMKTNYAKIKVSNDELKKDYALLLSWAKAVSDDLRQRGITYPDPPEKLETVIPKNEEHKRGYKL